MTMKILTIILALTATGYAAITVPPEPVESNVPPGSIVVPPPRDTGTTKPVAPAPVSTQPAVPQLRVSLADGSRLIGETTLKMLALRSEALGKLEIPLEKVRSIKLSKDRESAAIVLANGDKVQGGFVATTVALRTIFGPVTVPLAQVTDLEVSLRAIDAGLANGLVAHYPFQEDAKDRSGNENHGEVTGAVFEEGGLRFRGDNSTYMRVRRAESLEPKEGITIALWLKGVPGQGLGTVLRKADPGQLGYLIRGRKISAFQLVAGNAKSSEFSEFKATKWQHVGATYSRTDGVMATYQDGALVNQTPMKDQLLHTGDLYIGGAPVGAPFGHDDGGFHGLIAEVRIYNRALTEGEIAALAGQPPAKELP
jgi:hypothetical protein